MPKSRSARIREAEKLLGIESTHARRMREAAERKAEVAAQPLVVWPEFQGLDRTLPKNGPAPPPSPGFSDLWRRVAELRKAAKLDPEVCEVPDPGPRRIKL